MGQGCAIADHRSLGIHNGLLSTVSASVLPARAQCGADSGHAPSRHDPGPGPMAPTELCALVATASHGNESAELAGGRE